MKTIANNLGKILGLAIGTYISCTSGEVATMGSTIADYFLPLSVGWSIDYMWVNRKEAKGCSQR